MQADVDRWRQAAASVPQLKADLDRARASLADRDLALQDMTRSTQARAEVAAQSAQTEQARLTALLADKDGTLGPVNTSVPIASAYPWLTQRGLVSARSCVCARV